MVALTTHGHYEVNSQDNTQGAEGRCKPAITPLLQEGPEDAMLPGKLSLVLLAPLKSTPWNLGLLGEQVEIPSQPAS